MLSTGKIALNCKGCGAEVEIPIDGSTQACPYCNTMNQYVVQRVRKTKSNKKVDLDELEEAINKIEMNIALNKFEEAIELIDESLFDIDDDAALWYYKAFVEIELIKRKRSSTELNVDKAEVILTALNKAESDKDYLPKIQKLINENGFNLSMAFYDEINNLPFKTAVKIGDKYLKRTYENEVLIKINQIFLLMESIYDKMSEKNTGILKKIMMEYSNHGSLWLWSAKKYFSTSNNWDNIVPTENTTNYPINIREKRKALMEKIWIIEPGFPTPTIKINTVSWGAVFVWIVIFIIIMSIIANCQG